MNIAILSRGENLYSTQSLLRAGLGRNHQIEIIDPGQCMMCIENGETLIYHRNEPISGLHAVIPRIGASNTYFGSSLVRHFEGAGIFCTAGAEPILQSRNKWTCFQVLSKARVPVPHTILGNAYDIEAMVSSFGGAPVIIKVLQGTHGNGVILAESDQAAISTIETLRATKVRFLVQEYVAESEGADTRVIVVDGVVVAAMKRFSKPGDFRSNLHRGGSSQSVTLSSSEEHIALKAARALRLGVCGVDILDSENGPLVLEVNSTPGLEGIETTTGKNVAKSIIGYIERNKS